jgi:DNA-binding Lrp family transcriptional regulator
MMTELKKLTIEDRIIKAMKEHGDEIKVMELSKKLKINPDSLYNPVLRLKKEGLIKRVRNGIYKLTGVNKLDKATYQIMLGSSDTEVKELKASLQELKALHDSVVNACNKYKDELEVCQDNLRETSIKYYDALAVIAYLEKKYLL